MKVKEVGEFGLIRMLAEIADKEEASTGLMVGIGDDAAAWECRKKIQLGTTDILVEGVHFNRHLISWRDLGWKAMAINASDIAAMGGEPLNALVSLAIPPETEVEDIIDLYRGMAEFCAEFGMAIAGGNMAASPLVIINPTVIGDIEKDQLMLRSAARDGDVIAVTGNLGASAAGLRMLKESPELEPAVSAILTQAHYRPSPRVAEGQSLSRHGIRCATDISDGLMADLTHICEASRTGAEVTLADVPIHPAVHTSFPDDAVQLALTGGEDYELLFTGAEKLVEEAAGRLSVPVTLIGRITSEEPGKVNLLDRTGRPARLQQKGWEHFREP